jgi:hypothetical protein
VLIANGIASVLNFLYVGIPVGIVMGGFDVGLFGGEPMYESIAK